MEIKEGSKQIVGSQGKRSMKKLHELFQKNLSELWKIEPTNTWIILAKMSMWMKLFCSLYIGYINTVHNMTGVEKIKHRTSNMFIEYNFDLNKNEPKFNISDHVNNLKYKRIFKNLGFLLD